MKYLVVFSMMLFSIMFISCESESQKMERIKKENEIKHQKEIYNKYINNTLNTGAMPYSYFYGKNIGCDYGCSEMEITTPYNSDVLVIIKKNDKVISHAYIKASSRYTFDLPNGTYQPFFYYGKGWYPEKIMKSSDGRELTGGFLEDEVFSKDEPQTLDNQRLRYELILQQSGNFRTKESSMEEAL